MTALDTLEERVRRDLELTAYPRPEWVRPRTRDGEHVLDVLVVGAGQAGLTVAFALKRRAVTNVLLLDAAPAGSEGPWTTYAAMHTLRTPKTLTGPDQGLPSLTPEAWYRAAHGDAAWEDLRFIPKQHWQAYLGWFRKVTEPRVHNGVSVTGIRPAGDLLEVETSEGVRLARRVVLATGLAGNGEWTVPRMVRDALAPHRYAHTGERLDFARFAGQRVGVLGGGASAFDYAGAALEHGAAGVDLFYRRPEVPRVNLFRWMEFYAFGAHFPDLPDEDKWRYSVHFQRMNQPPPQASWHRCTGWDSFAWHTSADWKSVEVDGDPGTGEIVVATGAGEFRFDAVISATGPNVDLAARPELRDVAPYAATWADRFTPPAGWEDEATAGYPYLDGDFGFTERTPGSAPWLSRIHDFTYGARVSMGLNGNMNSGLGAGGRRLADALSRSLFLEDGAAFLEDYTRYDLAELTDLGRPDGGR
ncbi:NAD(P)/FAD-dependent oxidoreductase [Nocardioides sp. cx-169]|uniref:flavin-containing monooxygenase n=1 Tax=Nocardioides sp. cx-169 TaxID=2899080 RepID=UPI001E37BA75|nr:NAD(P)/FAD-dependent oxidoreductase [Nocardioides sp. cx-169]MCD4533546.1 NAD(P)/FAD-dependent oxidoreductase [Nocardioides sp. cx-169]